MSDAMLKKARGMSAWVFNVFKCRDTTTMMTLYKSMVRSIVEYCCPLWHPSKIDLTQRIEGLQRSFTAKLAQCVNMNYWERLKSLKLMSLQRRRERYVIMTMWKVLNGFHLNNIGIQFKYSKRNGMTAKLPQLARSCKSKHQTMYDSSFAVLGPKLWNLLPASVTLAKDLDIFKVELNRKFLSKIPDKPPVKGYPCANNNSLLEWCSNGTLLSGQMC